jgi:hypothetical protein
VTAKRDAPWKQELKREWARFKAEIGPAVAHFGMVSATNDLVDVAQTVTFHGHRERQPLPWEQRETYVQPGAYANRPAPSHGSRGNAKPVIDENGIRRWRPYELTNCTSCGHYFVAGDFRFTATTWVRCERCLRPGEPPQTAVKVTAPA